MFNNSEVLYPDLFFVKIDRCALLRNQSLQLGSIHMSRKVLLGLFYRQINLPNSLSWFSLVRSDETQAKKMNGKYQAALISCPVMQLMSSAIHMFWINSI